MPAHRQGSNGGEGAGASFGFRPLARAATIRSSPTNLPVGSSVALQALYRRWRPQRFEDVIGQEHITRTLRNAVAQSRLAHAYLFAGPRGTGKTSVARILAKAVNCTGPGEKPCNECAICRAISEGRALDLIEIDAASNTGVDDVRDLRDKIGFAPNEATYKVYVVDEVHMLSTAAFNALLKTLEEPPAHALFILATTEPHKIPDTIVSRCQRYDFRRVPTATLAEKLARICAAEGINAEPAALTLIARHATGSVRDAESLLDHLLAAGNTVRVADVQAALGTPASEAVSAIVEAMLARDSAAALKHLNQAVDQGADPRQLRSMLLEHLRLMLLLQLGVAEELIAVEADKREQLRRQASAISTPALAGTIGRFNSARPSADQTQPALPLELALVESVLALDAQPANTPEQHRGRPVIAPGPSGRGTTVNAIAGGSSQSGKDPRVVGKDPVRVGEPPATAAGEPGAPAGSTGGADAVGDAVGVAAGGRPSPSSEAAGVAIGEPGEPPAPPVAPTVDALLAQWPTVMAAVKQTSPKTAALLRDCRPVAVEPGRVTLGFFFEYHCQQVSETARRKGVEAVLAQLLGGPVTVSCTVIAPTAEERAVRPRSRVEQAQSDPLVRHAVERLGGRVTRVKPPEEESLDG